MKCEIQMDRSN